MSAPGKDVAATRRRRLSRERVVAAALAIVDRDGLAGLTMRALGRELDVDPMAVYHWVPRKAVLLDLIVEAVFAEIPLDIEMPPGDWKVRFMFAASVFRDTLRRHPHAVPVLGTRPAMSTNAMRPAEFVMAILREAGFSPEAALYAVGSMSNLVIGHVLAEVGLPPGTDEDVSDADRMAMFQAMTPQEFPNIVEAFGSVEFSLDQQFTFGIDALTRGLEKLRRTTRS